MPAWKIESGPLVMGDYTVEFVFADGCLGAEWSPGLPGPSRAHLIESYRAARDGFLARVQQELGIRIAVAEVM